LLVSFFSHLFKKIFLKSNPINLILALRTLPLCQFIFSDFKTIPGYNGLSAMITIRILSSFAGNISFVDVFQFYFVTSRTVLLFLGANAAK